GACRAGGRRWRVVEDLFRSGRAVGRAAPPRFRGAGGSRHSGDRRPIPGHSRGAGRERPRTAYDMGEAPRTVGWVRPEGPQPTILLLPILGNARRASTETRYSI